MSKRTFICLRCGKKVTVSSELYAAIRENPLCESCQDTPLEVNISNGVNLIDDVVEVVEYGLGKLSRRLADAKNNPPSKDSTDK